MSLVGSIFGKEKEEQQNSLFDKSLELPDKPQHKALPPREKKRKEAPLHEEPQKKKRKEREPMKEAKDATATEEADEKKASDADDDKDNVEERTVFVGNLPIDTTRKSLASMFKKCGKVESSRLRSVAAIGVKIPASRAGDQDLVKKVCANTNKLDTTNKATAQGYVVFESKDSVEEALKLNNTKIGSEGLLLRVDHATPTQDASRSVFVGNLPYKADETTLHRHFCQGCGCEDEEVEGVRIIRDKETMQCKGFGYILFRDQSMVAVALRKMHESKYMKRDLRVTVCGKRFKGRKGQAKDDSKRRSFEGKRSGAAAEGAIKRILGKKPSKADEKASSKKRRARGETKKGMVAKGGPKSAGVSKRAVKEGKAGKRMKKIQKRISKGMGKTRGR
jgi:nucleolar protein 12